MLSSVLMFYNKNIMMLGDLIPCLQIIHFYEVICKVIMASVSRTPFFKGRNLHLGSGWDSVGRAVASDTRGRSLNPVIGKIYVLKTIVYCQLY